MNIRIYQINMKRDTNNVAFMRYELLEKLQGSQESQENLPDRSRTCEIILLTVIAVTGATCYLYREFSLFCNAEVTAYPIRWLKSSELKS